MNNLSKNEEKNVFLQISHAWREFWDSFKNVSHSRKQTWFDEVSIIVKIVLFVATISTGISYALSNHIFFAWLGEDWSWYPAITLAVVLELGTVFIGLLFCRGLIKRQTYYSAPAFGILIFTGFVFILAAKWGYKLSSEGQSQLSIMFANKQAQTDTSFVTTTIDPRLTDINDQLSKIDGSIGQQSDAQNNAYSIRWRKRVTEEGRKLANQAGNNLGSLNNTKSLLLAEKIKIESQQDSTRKAQMGFNVKTQSQWTQLFGGYMELFKIFCIAALACCMVGIENLPKEDQDDETPTRFKRHENNHRRSIGFATGKAEQEERRPIGFMQNTVKNGVATEKQSSYLVATEKYTESEIATQVKNIQAWIAKFRKDEVKLTTADRNILVRLEVINRVMADYFALVGHKEGKGA